YYDRRLLSKRKRGSLPSLLIPYFPELWILHQIFHGLCAWSDSSVGKSNWLLASASQVRVLLGSPLPKIKTAKSGSSIRRAAFSSHPEFLEPLRDSQYTDLTRLFFVESLQS